MMRRLRFVLAGMLALAGVTHAATPLQPYTAEYEVFRNNKPLGHGVVTLKPDGLGHWELTSVTEGTRGLASLAGVEIHERSVIDLHDDRLETLGYEYRQSAGWKKRERSIAFDPAGKSIISRDRDREYRFDFSPGVLDRQAVSLALSRDVAAGKRDVLTYTVVDRDELDTQTFRIGAQEHVTTPAGKLDALRVERERTDARGRKTTSWLGVEQGYIPVRILQTESDGDSFEMRLVSLKR